MKDKKIIVAVIVGLVLISGIVIASKSSDEMDMSDSNQSMNTEQTMTEQMAEPGTIIMDNLAFMQREVSIKKGETITWRNEDTAAHNVIFDDSKLGEVEDSKLINQGEELKFTFNETGEFTYYCGPHPFMKAKVTVTE